jgi:seryl-tRNA synthetase
MLDLKQIRSQPEKVREALKKRGQAALALLETVLALEKKWRKFVAESDELKHRRKLIADEVARLKKEGKDTTAKQEEGKKIGDDIKAIEKELKQVEEELNQKLLFLPNLPHETVPFGVDASDNKVVRQWGEPCKFNFSVLPHWEIGENLGILDFKRSAKLSGSMFSVYMGDGARLQRALIQFMLDFHIEKHGYLEAYPPFIVKREIMVGTGQLPKFEEEMYHCSADDLFLIPTAEVPITNLHKDEILSLEELPKYYVGYTACFRREAGAAGAETRGLQRLHQFDKVELVKLVVPEKSYEEHEKLVADAEAILKALNLPYRVVLLCTGDMGFAAAKCYDIEVWAPAQNKWLEVSSCSNFEDFQARRANIRFRRTHQSKPEFVHTLNGSGLALPRLMIAILENYQQEDGSIQIPEALLPYMRGCHKIEKQQFVHLLEKKS